jgi:hypothetical protein
MIRAETTAEMVIVFTYVVNPWARQRQRRCVRRRIIGVKPGETDNIKDKVGRGGRRCPVSAPGVPAFSGRLAKASLSGTMLKCRKPKVSSSPWGPPLMSRRRGHPTDPRLPTTGPSLMRKDAHRPGPASRPPLLSPKKN